MASSVELSSRAGKEILFVMAAEAEYGPHLKSRFNPLITGVGPVEAAVVLSSNLAQLANEGRSPDLVVSLGSAGSRTLEQAAVYQVASVSYRDMDASALGFAKGQTPFLDIPITLELPYRIEGIPTASLSTGRDWTEYLHVIDEKLANAVDSLVIQLEQGSLAL